MKKEIKRSKKYLISEIMRYLIGKTYRYIWGGIAGLILLALFAITPDVQALGLERVGVIEPATVGVSLLGPRGFCYDTLRGLFTVADSEGQRVFVLDRHGNIFKTLGKGGELRFPADVAVNEAGTLFILAQKEAGIVKVLPEYNSGTGETYHDLDLSTYRINKEVKLTHIFVDRGGRLYIVDQANRQILVFDGHEKFMFAINKVGDPADVWAASGRIFVADLSFGGVRVYNDKGRWQQTLGTAANRFKEPVRAKAIAIDQRRRLWLLLEGDKGIMTLDSLGNPVASFPFSSYGENHILSGEDMVIDQNNYLYVLERGRGRIVVFRINQL
jgi:DNA-binding beta-propeller fold protein YncE